MKKSGTGENFIVTTVKGDAGNFGENWEGLTPDLPPCTDYYFESYSHLGIHEEMLKDSVRTGAYKAAILNNPHLFKNKVVLDVGAGTGILSLFAGQAGAAKVFALEASDIVHVGRKVVEENKLSHIITFIHGRAEEIELPVKQVDIIISEWMGYFLLYENVLDTVIFCRDKWLAPNGLLLPDHAKLYLAGIEDHEYREEKIGFWKHVYGFKYNCVRKLVMEEPVVDTVEQSAVTTTACCVLDIDLNSAKVPELNFSALFQLKLLRDDYVHALVAWFDVWFGTSHTPVHFTTSPFGTYTHWKQTVFYTENVLVCNKNEVIDGKVSVRRSASQTRDLEIKIYYNFNGTKSKAENTQFYRLR